MGGSFITDGIMRTSDKLLVRKSQEIDHLEDLSVDGRILLQMDLREIGSEGLVWF
jgi:hypothetical protein